MKQLGFILSSRIVAISLIGFQLEPCYSSADRMSAQFFLGAFCKVMSSEAMMDTLRSQVPAALRLLTVTSFPGLSG